MDMDWKNRGLNDRLTAALLALALTSTLLLGTIGPAGAALQFSPA